MNNLEDEIYSEKGRHFLKNDISNSKKKSSFDQRIIANRINRVFINYQI